MTSDELTKEGIPFVESIPDSWCLIPNKWLFRYDGHKVGKNWADYDLLSLTKEGVKTKSKESTGGKVPESYDGYQTVKPGQMIFCLFDLDVSAVFSGISNLQGMITSAYDVYSSTNLINNEFADYWFKYVFSSRYYKLYSKNIRYTITSDNFGMIKTPIPPLKIQEKIAAFLKSKEEKINALITNEEKQIEKLKEYKQALISEIVTKGLNPNIPMRDSNISLTPLIPSNFYAFKIKNVATTIDSKLNQSNLEYIALENVESFSGTKIESLESKNYDITNSIVCQPEDVIFGKLRPYLAKSLLITIDCCVSSEFAVFRCNKKYILPEYLHYTFISKAFVDLINSYTYGTKMPRANIDDIKSTIIPLPDIKAQKAAIKFITRKKEIIEKQIHFHLEKINSLKKYRKSLIYEYVTGKREIC